MPVICAQYTEGPNCSDVRKETTEAEKTDCITKAYMRCVSAAWTCRAYLKDKLPPHVGQYSQPPDFIPVGVESYTPQDTAVPLDDLNCYTTECLVELLKCYCAGGMRGLTCTACDDVNAFDPDPDDEDLTQLEEDDDDTASDGLDSQTTTFSDTDGVIPYVIGRVTLAGNIIWVSEPRDADIANAAQIDFAMGICAGPVEEILRVWVGSRLVIDNTAEGVKRDSDAAVTNMSVELYNGSDTQKISHLMLGSSLGRVPAYRGLTYVIVRGFPIGGADGKMPAVRVEVATKVTREGIAWEDSGIASDSLNYDPYSRRAYAASGTDIDVLDGDALSAIKSVTFDDTVEVVGLTSDEDLLAQLSDGTLAFSRARNVEERASIVVAHTSVELSGGRALSSENGDAVILSSLDDDSFLRSYYANEGTPALALLAELDLTGSTVLFHAVTTITPTSSSLPGRVILSISQASPGVVDIDTLLLNTHVAAAFDPDAAAWVRRSIALPDIGLGAGANVQSVTLLGDESVLLFVQDGLDNKIVKLPLATPRVPTWAITSPALPVGRVSVSAFGSQLTFLASDGLYMLTPSSGNLLQLGDDTIALIPVPGSQQSYDGVTDVITYLTAGGNIAKYRPERAAGALVSMSDALRQIFLKAGLSPDAINVNATAGINITGFVVASDKTFAGALEELVAFYHMGIVESSGAVSVLPLGTADTITVQEDDLVALSRTKSLDFADNVDFVRVGFFDSENEGAESYQDVSRSVLSGYDVEIGAQGVYITPNVSTDSDTARKSAELLLTRLVRKSKEYKVGLMPRLLAVEPVDILTLPNGETARIRKSSVDTTLAIEVEGFLDDASIYSETPGITGVALATSHDVIEGSSSVKNIPVVFNLPPAKEGFATERVYLGQVNPETTAWNDGFVADTMTVNGVDIQSTVTEEVMLGVLTSGFAVDRTEEFTTDLLNTFVVTFAKEIPSGTFTAYTTPELCESYTLNLIIVGRELIQFQSASIAGDNRTVTFSGLLRGRFGTDPYIRSHSAGEPCAIYTPESFIWQPISSTDATRGAARLGLRSPDFDEVAREADYSYDSVREEWDNVRMIMQEYPNLLTTSQERIEFTVYPRIPYRQSFRDSGQIDILPYGEDGQLFVLASEFDVDLFREAYEAGNWGPSSYITRSYDGLVSTIKVPYADLKADGYVTGSDKNNLSLVADIHLALQKGADYKRAIGFKIGAGTRYYALRPGSFVLYNSNRGRVSRVF